MPAWLWAIIIVIVVLAGLGYLLGRALRASR